MSEEEKQKQDEEEEQALYVNTAFRGQKKIEVLGIQKSYNWRNDISRSVEVSLQQMRISRIGPIGELRDLIPN